MRYRLIRKLEIRTGSCGLSLSTSTHLSALPGSGLDLVKRLGECCGCIAHRQGQPQRQQAQQQYPTALNYHNTVLQLKSMPQSKSKVSLPDLILARGGDTDIHASVLIVIILE